MSLLALPDSGAATIAVGIGILILGYLVKFRGWTGLFAGHNPNAVTDEDALADLAGETLLFISLVIIVFGGLIAADLTLSFFEEVVTAVILLAVAQYVYRNRRYATT